MDLSIHTMLFLIFSICLWSISADENTEDLDDEELAELRPIYKTIAVKNGAKRGFWAWEQSVCPSGYAKGFSIKVDSSHGKLMWQDDSSLNGIRLYCSDDNFVDSRVGVNGIWTFGEMCPLDSYLISFELRVARPQPLWVFGDDAGVTNIKFNCSDGTELTGDGQNWGKFGEWSPSCSPGYICGIRTRIDSVKAWIDTSGLNDVMFSCCL